MKIAIRTFVALALVTSSMVSVAASSTIDDKVDDLFLKASSGEVRYIDLVEPSKNELIQMGIDAVPQLITKLSSEDARERHTLVDIFAGIGEPAVPSLIEALQTDSLYALRNALECLGRIGDKTATGPLLMFFDHENHSVRSSAVTAVGRCRDSTAVNQCIGLMQDSVESVRKSAAVALGRIGDAGATEPLISALDDSHFSVRMSSVAALTAIGDSACVSLLNQYGDLSSMAKALAFEVWAKSNYSSAADTLLSATNSDDPYTRAFAIVALASVHPEKAQQLLQELRENETSLFVISQIKAAENLLNSPKN